MKSLKSFFPRDAALKEFSKTDRLSVRAFPDPLKELIARTELSTMHRTYPELEHVQFHLNFAYMHAEAAVIIAKKFDGQAAYVAPYLNAHIALMHASHALQLTEQAQKIALAIKGHPQATSTHIQEANKLLPPRPSLGRWPTF